MVLTCGCAAKNVTPGTTGSNNSTATTITSLTSATEKTQKIADFMSSQVNTEYIYTGEGNEYASYNIFIDYASDNRVQTRTNNGGTESVKVIENKDGQLRLLLSKGECYYRENFIKVSDDVQEILLKEPLVKGTSWSLPNGSKRSISNVDVSITTPTGSYKALEVTTENKDSKIIDYYAPNVGLVKSIFSSGDSEITSTLSNIKNNTPFMQTVAFYYPNINDGKLYYINKQLSFNTNDITKSSFEKAFKEQPNASVGKVLSPNAKINSLYLNKDAVVYVDFSKEFVSEMNAGSGYEGMILQSITNTLGTYYGVSKVYITVENEPYSSGHFAMKKGEAFTVDLKNSVEIK